MSVELIYLSCLHPTQSNRFDHKVLVYSDGDRFTRVFTIDKSPKVFSKKLLEDPKLATNPLVPSPPMEI